MGRDTLREGVMAMVDIDDKDFLILDCIYDSMQKRNYPPTVRELCNRVGLKSTASVHVRLTKLQKLGYITRDPSTSRSMRLVNYRSPHAEEEERDPAEVPVYGKVAAGAPITAFQETNFETFVLPEDMVKHREVFMLKVKGNSMINAAILDGDYIIVERTQTAENGEQVVALVNDEEATVKTFYKENGHYRLQPENDTMDPIITDNVTILGKVTGVFRKY